MIIVAVSSPLADAVMPVADVYFMFYPLLQPKLATIADISTLIWGCFMGVICRVTAIAGARSPAKQLTF